MNALLYRVYVIVDDNVDNHRDGTPHVYAILSTTHAVPHSSLPSLTSGLFVWPSKTSCPSIQSLVREHRYAHRSVHYYYCIER